MEISEEFWKFVEENATANSAVLRLKYHGKGHDLEITQIECRQKFGKKLAETLRSNPRFLFPSVLAGEQSTSDALADVHCQIVANALAANVARDAKIADLTAGLGIDALHFNTSLKGVGEITAIEWDRERAEALRLNLPSSIKVLEGDCREIIENWDGPKLDIAFIDPARRGADGSRVFDLADCEPNVLEMLPKLREICNKLVIKASPMLDITRLANDLKGVELIMALGTTTECKELVAVVDLGENAVGKYKIQAHTVGAAAQLPPFTPEEERNAECKFANKIDDGGYLYEPYPATMKAAPFNILSQINLSKLHPNTNLYFSGEAIDGFPGERWKVLKTVTYESKNIKRLKKEFPEIRVTTRNFDMSAESLRKKLGVKDGGEKRLFAVTLYSGQKVMIITEG